MNRSQESEILYESAEIEYKTSKMGSSRFDFILKHIPGIKMRKTDGFSKRPDLKVGIENDNSNQIFIKNHWIFNLYEVVVEESKVDIVKKIKKS